MKKALVVAFLAVSTMAQAGDIWNKNEKWDMSQNQGTITVNRIAVNNVSERCEAESKKRGMGGFGYSVQACTFWTGDVCTIITAKKETHHTLGHEFYHCFAKGFH